MKIFSRSKLLCAWLVAALVCDSIAPAVSRAQIQPSAVGSQLASPAGRPAALTTDGGGLPAVLKGVKIFPDDPLRLDFILSDVSLRGARPGDEAIHKMNSDEIASSHKAGLAMTDEEALKLIKYFLASLAVPEGDLWVNLNPKEPDRIIPETLGRTDMGRELLAQDYLLKQLASSLLSPDGESGKKFWDTIYQKMYEATGSTDVPVEMLNRVWIVPSKAVVYNAGDAAYVVEAKLKVLLEEEYAQQKNVSLRATEGSEAIAERINSNEIASSSSGLLAMTDTKDILRQTILPLIEKEVNEGESFAPLRQIFYSLILAKWFKKNLKDTLLGHEYAEHNKIQGIDIPDGSGQEIYDQYLKAFQNGAFQHLKESYDPSTQQIVPRQYFSGGFAGAIADKDFAELQSRKLLPMDNAGLATLTVRLDAAMMTQAQYDWKDVETLVEALPDDTSWREELKKKLVFLDPKTIKATEELVSKKKILEMVKGFQKKGAVFPTPIMAVRTRNADGTEVVSVLDGNHRLQASINAGLQFVPVILLDWDDLLEPEVWRRAFQVTHVPAVERLIQRWETEDVIRAIDWNANVPDDQTVLAFGDQKYIFSQSLSKLQQHRRVTYFLKIMENFQENVGNITKTEDELMRLWENPGNLKEKSWMTMRLPKFTKQELRELFKKGVILPPKAFRTKLPREHMAMSYSVDVLKDPQAVLKMQVRQADISSALAKEALKTEIAQQLTQRFWLEFQKVSLKSFDTTRNISPNPKFDFPARYVAFIRGDQRPSEGGEDFLVLSRSGIQALWSSYDLLHDIHLSRIRESLEDLQHRIHTRFQEKFPDRKSSVQGFQLQWINFDDETHKSILRSGVNTEKSRLWFYCESTEDRDAMRQAIEDVMNEAHIPYNLFPAANGGYEVVFKNIHPGEFQGLETWIMSQGNGMAQEGLERLEELLLEEWNEDGGYKVGRNDFYPQVGNVVWEKNGRPVIDIQQMGDYIKLLIDADLKPKVVELLRRDPLWKFYWEPLEDGTYRFMVWKNKRVRAQEETNELSWEQYLEGKYGHVFFDSDGTMYAVGNAAMLAEHPWKNDPQKEYLGTVIFGKETFEHLKRILSADPEKSTTTKVALIEMMTLFYSTMTESLLRRMYAWSGKEFPQEFSRAHISFALAFEQTLAHGIENAIDSYWQRQDEEPDFKEDLKIHFYVHSTDDHFNIWYVANGYGLKGAETTEKKMLLGSRRLGGYGQGGLLAYTQSAKFGGAVEPVQDRMELIGDERGSVNQLTIDKVLFLRHYDAAMMAGLNILLRQAPKNQKNGGIDLNGFEVETKGSRQVPVARADAAQLSETIPLGLKPVIESIGPADLNAFLNIPTSVH